MSKAFEWPKNSDTIELATTRLALYDFYSWPQQLMHLNTTAIPQMNFIKTMMKMKTNQIIHYPCT